MIDILSIRDRMEESQKQRHEVFYYPVVITYACDRTSDNLGSVSVTRTKTGTGVRFLFLSEDRMWFRDLQVNGLRFTMFGDPETHLMLSTRDIEKVGNRITEIIDWFKQNGDEFGLVELWKESHYSRQFFRDSELKTIYNSRFASAEDKEAVVSDPPREVPPKRTRKQQAGFVYVIKGQGETYKIGKSVDAQERIRSLGVVLPFAITPIHVIKAKDMNSLERSLHERFGHKKVNGEWFSLSDEDLSDIREITEC